LQALSRARRKRPDSLDAIDLFLQALPQATALLSLLSWLIAVDISRTETTSCCDLSISLHFPTVRKNSLQILSPKSS
jgi:hypothetical protein